MHMSNSSNIKTVLITGSNGFIGSNLVERLCREDGYAVRAMILKGTPEDTIRAFQRKYNAKFKEKFGIEKLKVVYADLLKPVTLKAAAEGCDSVVHLAGLVTDWGPAEAFFELIERGTENLLNSLPDGIERFILMSSLTVHDLDGHCIDDEDCPRNMEFFTYGVAKIRAEDLVREWAEESRKRDYACVRPGFNIYGPRDRASFIVALDAALKGKFGFINGGKSLISYVYVENLVHGIVLMLEAQDIDGPYIISDGNKTWFDFVKSWTEAAGVEMPVISVPYWLISPFVWILEKIYRLFKIKRRPILTLYNIRIMKNDLAFSSEKAETELGYVPLVPYDETIKRTLQYYRDEYETKK